MLSLHTNPAALAAQNALVVNGARTEIASTRLGTGLRVNSAMDDAAGLQIATRLRVQTSGMSAAKGNMQKSQSILQTADGALDEATTILIRMKDLATQAADGASTDRDRQAMQDEFSALTNQVSTITTATTFGGERLLMGDTVAERAAVATTTANAVAAAASTAAAAGAAAAQLGAAQAADAAGSTPATRVALGAAQANLTVATAQNTVAQAAASAAQDYADKVAQVKDVVGLFSTSVQFQIGAASSEAMTVSLTPLLDAMHTALHAASSTYDTFGIQHNGNGTDLLLASGANAAIDNVRKAIDAVATVRSALGANVNRLDHALANEANMALNTQLATGRLVDTDYAQESADFISSQMMTRTSGTMLHQASSMISMLMALLR
jgi:flagellin